MAYVAPYISSAGLTIPSFQDILADLLAQFQTIYGSTVYLGLDSSDYQFIAAVALKIYDTNAAVQLVYNARGPSVAIGSDLDAIVKINGLARLPATYSTCQVTCAGTPFTTITNGIVQDVNGNQWGLPTTVVIGSGGSVSVTATAVNPGMIQAVANTLTIRATPTAGWLSVTNPNAASAGSAVEADSALRARQAVSVALPSRTTLGATISAIAAVPGVTRYNVAENATGAIDANGLPAHSISAIVEGGVSYAIAFAIYQNKTIGCQTFAQFGTVNITVTDPFIPSQTTVITFGRPTYIPIVVGIVAQGLTGYTSATTAAIQTAVVNYLNSLQIGQAVIYSEIYGAALTARNDPDMPLFSLKQVTLASGVPAPSAVFQVSVGNSGGTGYSVGAGLFLTGGNGAANVQVTSIGPGGVVTGLISPVPIAGAGFGYSVANNVPTTGGIGTGCTVDILSVQPTAMADVTLSYYACSQGFAANVVVAAI
jgi:uncharacterized phage protein gp47/JayE